ncbi:hypothetical protein D043_0338 [Vibrio parahaemolyticus EKP-021]|nr:hypothetical protein D043_0338 [Vibrio parahaemolyticus EKP-021]
MSDVFTRTKHHRDFVLGYLVVIDKDIVFGLQCDPAVDGNDRQEESK